MSCRAHRLLDEADREPWQAEITRSAPWTWSISYVQGLRGMREGSLVLGTRKHAESVARRNLRRLERAGRRHADRTTITGGTT